jgi:hypothetical protein
LSLTNLQVSNKITIIPAFITTDNEYKKLPLQSLFANTKTFQDLLASLLVEKVEKTKKTKASTTEVVVETTEVAPAVEAVVEETVEATEAEEDDDASVNFRFHIGKIVKQLIHSDEVYNGMKIGKAYSQLCSDIVIDILKQIVAQIPIWRKTINNKTITKTIFSAIIESFLIYNNDAFDFKALDKTIEATLEEYRIHKETDKTEKKIDEPTA